MWLSGTGLSKRVKIEVVTQSTAICHRLLAGAPPGRVERWDLCPGPLSHPEASRTLSLPSLVPLEAHAVNVSA